MAGVAAYRRAARYRAFVVFDLHIVLDGRGGVAVDVMVSLDRAIRRVPMRSRPRFCRLIYSDGRGAVVLRSQWHNLHGKPDFIYKRRVTGGLIPMELKSGKAPDAPHLGDLMQLAAYFIIIEESHGKRPRRGVLRYADGMFVVKNTMRLRRQLLSITADMRLMLKTGQGAASPSFVKCRYCVARDTVCEFCL